MGLGSFFCMAIFALVASLGSCELDLTVLVDSRIPKSCSSPGWRETPHDVAVVLGGYVTFRCRTVLYHTQVFWIYNGKTVVVAGPSTKYFFSDSNRTVIYGPVEVIDDGAILGCEVNTPYGLLPSQVGKITIKSLPLYKPEKVQVAYLGKSFEFNFGYSSSSPPSSFSWTKNGRPFKSFSPRVSVDHAGIIFTRVISSDAGRYIVTASNKAGSSSASAILKVLSYKKENSGTSSTHKISTKLAISLAMEQSSSNSSVFHDARKSTGHASKYAQHVIRLFQIFKKPSTYSRHSGIARVKTEQLLLAISKLTGSRGENMTLSDDDMTMLESSSNCSSQTTPTCSVLDLHFRSADGTCNNFFYPRNGAAGSPLARILPALYEDGISAPVGLQQLLDGKSFRPPWPSARFVSWKVIRNLPVRNPDDITHMTMQWGQFVDHDLDISPVFSEMCDCSPTLTCIPIEVSPNDDVFGTSSSNNANCLTFSRSIPTCSSSSSRRIPRNPVNDLTSYIDASNVYGSSKEVANQLRLFKGGLLKQGGRLETLKGNLPVMDSRGPGGVPFFVAGDIRVNEQVGLTIMHTVWLREHNRIARQLMRINRCWNDERLYQETRKIVGAMQQVITFTEYLPVIFGPHFKIYLSRYRGYNPFIDATIPNSFSAAAYRFGHSLVRDRFDRLDRNYRRLRIGPLPLRQAFFNPISYFDSLGTDPILRGLTVAKSNAVDEFMNVIFSSQLFAQKGDDLGMDLISLNIQRGRDHGLPTYRQWERFCRRLYPQVKASFSRTDTERILKEVYGEQGFRRGIDLFVGGLAEKRLPRSQLGPTFACILGVTFSKLRDGDRFWYQNPSVFNYWQRMELQKTTLAKVVCTNGDDIPNIQRSVFEGGQRRVKCSRIPAPNLWRWKDRRCYNKRQYYG